MPRYAALLFPLVAINLALADPRQGVNLARRAVAKDNGNINSGNGNGASITGAGNNAGAGTNPTGITTALTSTITTFTVIGNGITETELIFATTDTNNNVATVTSTLAANGIGAGAGSNIQDQVPGADAGTGTGTGSSGSGTDNSGAGTGDSMNSTCPDVPAAMMAAATTTITQCEAMPTSSNANKGKENYILYPIRPGHREPIGFWEENKGKDVYYIKVSIETMAYDDSKAKGFTTYQKPKQTGTGQNGYQNAQQNGEKHGQQNGQNGQQNGQGYAQNAKKGQGNQGY